MLRDRGRAEEVAQDIFLKVWRALPGYDGRASLSTWLYVIARNTCLSAIRSESYRRTDLLPDVVHFASCGVVTILSLVWLPVSASVVLGVAAAGTVLAHVVLTAAHDSLDAAEETGL